jgi:hypothetical protein
MLGVILLLLNALFEIRRTYHEIRILARLARWQLRNRKFRALTATFGLAMIALGPLGALFELFGPKS